MNNNRTVIPTRSEAWRNAAWYALIAAAGILLLIKFLTGIMFLTALGLAMVLFVIVFGLLLRMTPRRED